MTNYLLAGGGTAGHVNPLLALAQLIRERESDAKLIAVGTAEGLESRLVPQQGLRLETIARLPFPRKPGKYALEFPMRYRRAVRQLRELMRVEQVDVVVGFGGYASAPCYTAASREKIPYVIHEANALPGMANKLGARGTKFVGVTFPGTKIPHAQVTGMPLRKEITSLDRAGMRAAAAEFFGLEPDKPTLLVTGGSLGSRGINLGVLQAAGEILASGAQVLHIWGGLTQLEDPQLPGYRVLAYCDRMELAFAACDVVISRAGATTVSEIAGLGIPAFFAPYRVGNGEQARNCQAIVAAGGAMQIEDEQITSAWVRAEVIPLLHDVQRQQRMSAAAKSVARLDGTQRLYELTRSALAAV